MLRDFLHVVPGSLHPVAEVCSAHPLVPREFLRWHCYSALPYCFDFQASEMQRDSSLHSDLRAVLLRAAPSHSPWGLNVQIVSIVLEDILWRLCEGPCCRKRDCRLANWV